MLPALDYAAANGSARYLRPWTGPLVSAVIFAAVVVCNRLVITIPNPGVILLLGVIYSTLVGGPVYGVCSTLLLGCMGALASGIPILGHVLPGMVVRLIIFTVTGFTVVTVITILLRRLARLQNARNQEERAVFKSILASLHDAVLECDWRGIRDVNPSFCRMTGFSREELVGCTPPFPFWPAEEYARIASALERAMRGQALDFELVLVRKTGERFPVLLSVSRLNHNASADPSAPARTVYTFRDISELKSAQESLAASERHLAEIIEAADLGLWEMDLATNQLHWNEQKLRMMGMPLHEKTMDAEVFWRRVHPDDRDALKQVAARLTQVQTPLNYDFRVVLDDGSVHHFHGRGRCVRDASGAPKRLVGLTFARSPQN